MSPFNVKIGYIRDFGLEWRFSYDRLRMANDTVTPNLVAFLFSNDPKW